MSALVRTRSFRRFAALVVAATAALWLAHAAVLPGVLAILAPRLPARVAALGGAGGPPAFAACPDEPVEEVCDGQDNDCDGQTDEGFDADGDGVAACAGDCDDADADRYPGRPELPDNRKDDDCDPATPDDFAASYVVATTDSSGVWVVPSNGDGTWGAAQKVAQLAGYVRGAAAADFDEDGDLDFVVPSSVTNGMDFLLYRRRADGGFDAQNVGRGRRDDDYLMDMAAGDFDRDGHMDFVASPNSRYLNVALGDGRGGFAITQYDTTFAQSRGVDAGDVNGDGILDLVRATYSSGEIRVLRGNGAGQFTSQGVVGDVGSDPYCLALGDFDEDGDLDIVANAGGGGEMYLLRGRGDGTFAAAEARAELDHNDHGTCDAYDWDRDGHQDLVVGTYGNRRVKYYRGRGDGGFEPAADIATISGENVLGISAPPTQAPVGVPRAYVDPRAVQALPGAALSFTGGYSRDDGAIVDYTWALPGGVAATGLNVTHVFPAAEGRYPVVLTVTDGSARKASATSVVTLSGEPPVARAGGPYAAGEERAEAGVWRVPLDGRASSDDGGAPLRHLWDFGNPFREDFASSRIHPGVWASSGAVVATPGAAVVTGSGSWGARYLVTKLTFDRGVSETYVGRLAVPAGGGRVMWGLKNTGESFSYTQFVYAIYFQGPDNGISVYEDGTQRGGRLAVFQRDRAYDVRIDLHAGSGASYFYRETGSPDWIPLHQSVYSAATSFRLGATVYDGAITVGPFEGPAGFSLSATATAPYAKPGTYPLVLGVMDGVGLADDDATSVTVSAGAPPVADPGGPYVATEAQASCGTWTITLDGSASSDDRGILAWEWDFGDGTTGTGAKPSHGYRATGVYPVRLTVVDHALQTASATTTVTVTAQAPPAANPGGPYRVDERNAVAGQWTAVFDGRGSSDDRGLCDYAWSFGDGSTGTGATPTRKYQAAGTYTVTLTVRDHALQSHTAQTTIDVLAGAPPVPDTGGPYVAGESSVQGDTFQACFDAGGSTDDVGILEYEWDFGDGSAKVKGRRVCHRYAALGQYTVTLKVTDNARQSVSSTTTLTLSPGTPPEADAGPDVTAEIGQPIVVDGTQSSDDVEVAEYRWDFGRPATVADPVADALDPAKWTKSATARIDGDRVLLTGNNSDGPQLAQTLVTDRATGDPEDGWRPSFRAIVRVDPGGGTQGWGLHDETTSTALSAYPHLVYFSNGTLRLYENGSPVVTGPAYAVGVDYELRIDPVLAPGTGAAYYWRRVGEPDWTGLGVSATGATARYRMAAFARSGVLRVGRMVATESGPETLAQPRIVHRTPGTHTLSLTVVDHAGQRRSDSTVVTVVEGTGPTANAGGPYRTSAGFPTLLSAEGSSDDFGIAWYDWDFGDGETTRTANPLVDHVYAAVGTYAARLTATDHGGRTSTSTATVTVTADPVVAAVPWAFVGGSGVPHDTWDGWSATLKAMAWSADPPLAWEWDFGDGAAPTRGTAASPGNPYLLEAKHVYRGVTLQPFTARVTVTDASGRTATATYPLVIRDRTLDVEQNVAIDNGLWYLNKAQSRSAAGGKLLGTWTQSGSWPEMSTASSLQAFLINGHRQLVDARQDPYADTVRRGLNVLFGRIDRRTLPADPGRMPDGNNNAFRVVPTNDTNAPYQLGMVMDALAASGTPDWHADTGPAGIVHRTYRDLAQDMIDAYAWGQRNDERYGGWRYAWNSDADNSACQWAAIGVLGLRDRFHLDMPSWAKRWNDNWLTYTFDGSGFGYGGPGNGTATTPSGLVQLVMDGITRDEARWVAAESTIATNWNSWYKGTSNEYALFALTKAMRLARPAPIERLRSSGANDGLDWFRDPVAGVARTLVNEALRSTDGSFPGSASYVGNPARSAWAVIMLTPSLFRIGPTAVAGRDRVWGVDVPLTVDGSGSFHRDPARRIVRWEWDFEGDGTFDTASAEPTATHTYTRADYPPATLPRDITVRLRVTDDNDPPITDVDSLTVTLAEPPHPPVARAGGPYRATVGLPVVLDGSASFDIDPTDVITAWQWDTNDDRVYGDLVGSTVQLTFAQPGTYPIGLRVLDDGVLNDVNGNGVQDPEERLEDFAFTSVTVEANVAPQADAGGPYAVAEGGDVTLDARATLDPNGDPLVFTWDLDDDGSFDDAVGATPAFRGRDDAVQPVRVAATDGLLTATAATTVTVTNVAPAFALGGDRSLAAGVPLVLGVTSFTDPGVADTHAAEVAWGDGAVGALAVVQAAGGGTFDGAHAYAVPGQFTVTIVVRDDDGGEASRSFAVTVGNGTPVVEAGPDRGVEPGQALELPPAVFADANPGDTHTATIDWGDGTVTAGTVVEQAGQGTVAGSHVYAAAGTYRVRVTVTDDHGASGSDEFDVGVVSPNEPPVARIAGPAVVAEGDAIVLDASGSSDPDGDPLAFQWDLDGDGLFQEGTGPTASFAGVDDGQVVVRVAADDGTTVAFATHPVTVDNVAPRVSLAAAPAARVGEPLAFHGAFTDPGVRDTHTIVWDFGDASLPASAPLDTQHAFAAPGRYTVTLTVVDDDGGMGRASVAVEATYEPACITDLAGSAVRGVPVLTWSDVGAERVAVYRSAAPGGPWELAGETTSRYAVFADAAVPPLVAVHYLVRPVFPGVGEYCDSNVIRVDRAALTLLRIDDLVARHKDGVVALGWTPIAGAASQAVYRRAVGGPWVPIADALPGDARFHLDDAAANGTVYEYVVRWRDAGGHESADSNVAGASPTAGVHRRPDDPDGMPPQILSTAPVAATPGVPYAYDVVARDPDPGDVLAYALETAPAGMTIDAGGAVRWTPDAGAHGVVDVALSVRDRAGHVVGQRFWIDLGEGANAPPRITSEPPAAPLPGVDVLQGQPYAYDVEAADPDAGDLLEFDLPEAPAGMRIDPRTGAITWRPGAAQVGAAEVVVRVRDWAGAADEQRFTVVVGDVNDAPRIVSQPVEGVNVGATYAYALRAEDADPGDTLAYSLVRAPAGMTIDAAGGDVAWQPGAADAGTHRVVVRVEDAAGARDEQEYRLVANGPPTIVSVPPTTVTVGSVYQYGVEVRDPNAGDAFTFALLAAPAGMTIQPSGGAIAWIPGDADVGAHEVVVDVVDAGGLHATQSFTLTVTRPNRAPRFTSVPPLLGVAGTVYAYQATATDPDGDALRFELGAGPAGMAVSAAGAVAWTAVPGTHDVELRVLDPAGLSDTQAFRVVVADPSRGPRITSVPVTGATQDVAWAYDVEAADPDDDPLTFLLAQAPAGMTIDTASGLIGWTPRQADVGAHAVRVRVQDPTGLSDEQAFTLVVANANDPPVIVTTPEPAADEGQPYRYDVDATDPDGDLLTYALAEAPDGMAIDAESGVVTWTPGPRGVGLYRVVVRAADPGGLAATQAWDLLVRNVNEPPEIVSDPVTGATVAVPYFYAVEVADPDPDETLAFTLLAGPPGLQLEPVTGVAFFTPTEDVVGDHRVRIRVEDAAGAADEQEYDLRIKRTNAGPAIVSEPILGATRAVPYAYAVEAVDPDDDAALLRWRLDAGPAGMTVDRASGVLAWVPGPEAVGAAHRVVVTAYDPARLSDTQAFDVVVKDTNAGPAIVSQPVTTAAEDAPYAYDVAADDPDDPPAALRWRLVEGPVGMTLEGATGALRWTPTHAQIGTAHVAVRVEDPARLADTQAFDVTVAAVPHAPEITSTPFTSVSEGATYEYQVVATDRDDGDVLTFSLDAGPSGLAIDPASGLVTWATTAADVGVHEVAVRVTDATGRTDTQAWTLTVAPRPTTTSTSTSSSTSTTTTTSSTTTSSTTAASTSSTTLASTTTSTIATSTTVTPSTTSTTTPTGDTSTTVPATSSTTSTPASSTTSTTLEPRTVPDVRGLAQGPASAAILAAGLTVGAVSSAPSPTVPAGLVAAQTPEPGAVVPGGTGVDLVISLGVGSGDLRRPEVRITASPSIAQTDETVDLVVVATDDVAVTQLALEVNGQPLALDAAGRATFGSPAAGIFVARATALDAAGNAGVAEAEITIRTPGDTTPPTVALTAPADQARATTRTTVTGTATDTSLVRWVLELSEKGLDRFTTIAAGTTGITAGSLGVLDPSVLENGLFDLRLRAEDASGNVAVVSRTVEVAGDAKVGNFSISFDDLVVPVGNLPITVRRTYDSRNRSRGDFGAGWTLDVVDLKLRETQVPGRAWSQTRSGSLLPTYSLVPSGRHAVIVTFPDGRTETFTMAVSPASQGIVPIQFVDVSWTRAPGTRASLVSLANNSGLLVNGGIGPVELVEIDTLEPYDPDRYQLTDGDGTRFTIHQTAGVERVVEPNGDTIVVGSGGLVHSAGRSVLFTRDAAGRITRVTDPLGRSIVYEYDFYGDLVAVTDREGNVTRFGYDARHGLVDVVDPRGIRQARNEYDASGRLVATVDAAGNRMELEHDLGTNTEIVRDRRGNTTVVAYDAGGNVTRETDALGNSKTYTYDASGNRLTDTDALGRTTTRTFDASGNELTRRDPLGNTITNAFDASNNPTSIRDANGSTLQLGYDANGNPTTSRDGGGGLTTNVFDAAGRLTRTTDALGRVTQYAYDGAGNRIQEIDPLGNVFAYTYDLNGNRTSESRQWTSGGVTTTLTRTWAYDANGRVVRETDFLGGVTLTTYDGLGKPATRTDPLGRRTTYAYDARGNLVLTRYPDGTTEARAWDAEDNEIAFTDRAGRTTTYEYDAVNRRVRTVFPDGAARRTEYDAAGQAIAEIDERGNRTENEYDAGGRLVRVTDPLGASTGTSYDAAGNVLSQTDARGNRTEFRYDALNRRTRTIHPDLTETSSTYDAGSRKLSETDQAGNTTRFAWDALGRLLRVTDALGNVTAYAFDELGNRVEQVDAEGRITRWTYDALGRVLRHTRPDGSVESFTWDAVGNMTSHTDFMGRTTTLAHDANDRVLRRILPDGAVEAYAYTPTGQVATTTDPRGVTARTYDLRDRLVRIDHPDGTFLAYAYDAAGNRTTLTTPGGVTQTTYDAKSRLASVTDAAGGVTTYAYDAVGNLAAVALPNGTATSWSYDASNRLTQVEHAAAGTPIARFAYTLGPSGNRVRVDELGGRSVEYGYDATYKLTAETVTDPSTGVATTSYTYDAVGNRLTKTVGGATTTYAYDVNDRLVAAGGVRFTSDGNGNTVARSDGTTFAYDVEDQLVSVSTPSGTTTYAYDAEGERVARTQAGGTVRYLVDGERDASAVVETRAEDGTLVARFELGLELLAQRRGGATAYVHRDGLGSTRLLTDAAGAVTDTFTYEAFGDLAGRTGATPIEHLFAGEQRDPNGGFYYLRARWYSPGIGRFLTADSFPGLIHDPPSLHKYTYAANRPVDLTDPSGHFFAAGMIAGLNANVMRALAGVRAAFMISRALGGAALRTLGLVVEQAVGQVLRAIPGSAVRQGYAIVGQGGRRVLDFWVQASGRTAIIEAKYSLPRVASPAFQRLVAQMRTALTAEEAAGAQVVLYTHNAPTAAQMAALLAELGPGASLVQHVSGLFGLVQWARLFFFIPF